MIWPFSKSNKTEKTTNFKIQIIDTNGNRWNYKPVKHITALEVAKLLPLFSSFGKADVDYMQYIKQENLERHFIKDE